MPCTRRRALSFVIRAVRLLCCAVAARLRGFKVSSGMLGSRIVRRTGWAIGDQALSSLTNFGIAIIVARFVNTASFGIFGLAIAAYLLVLGVSRSVSSDPLLIRFSTHAARTRNSASAQSAGTALAIGTATAAVLLIGSLVASGALRLEMIVLGLSFPGLLLQDTYRYALFARGSTRSAAANDLLWLIVELGGVLVIILVGATTVPALTAAWGAGAAAGALFGAYQTGANPKVASSRKWAAQHRDLSVPFLGESLINTGGASASMFGIAALAGLSAVGSLRSAAVLFGPLTVFFLGANVVGLPELVRLRESSELVFRRLLTALGLLWPAITLAWTAVLAILPASVGTAFLGSNWTAGQRVVLPYGLMTAAIACTMAALLGLRAVEAARQGFRARLLAAPCILAGGLIGARLAGVQGAAVGLAVGYCVDTTVAWVTLRRVLRTRLSHACSGG
jgi:O-antigen/teichoic acid export membrane protein